MQRFKEESFVGNTQKKRIQINHNGDFEHGKVLYMEPDWSYLDLLNAASQRLDLVPAAKRIFSVDGNEIDDCMMIEDHDILFFSIYEDFIPLTATNNILSSEHDNKNKYKQQGENIPPIIGGYKVGELLGRGGFGEVRIGEHQFTNEKVALKFLKKSEIHSLGAAERTNIEIQCLTTLKHTNIIKMQQHLECTYHIVLVFELMEGGDLLKFLLQRKGTSLIESKDNNHNNTSNTANTKNITNNNNNNNNTLKKHRLNEEEARHVFYQIVSAISYAHNQHICHRDLKLENILLKDNTLSLVKIADFGLSDFYRPGSTMKSNCGTLSFLAPEVFQGTSNAGPPLDVWSLGVILFAILNGRLPFEGPDLKESKRPRDAIIKSRILKCQYKIDENLSIESKDLIRRMLQVDPTERASIPEIFNHIWMRSYGNQSSYLSDYFYLNNNIWDSPNNNAATKKYLVHNNTTNNNNIHSIVSNNNNNNSRNNESIHTNTNQTLHNNNSKNELNEKKIRNNDWHIKSEELDNNNDMTNISDTSLFIIPKLSRSRNELSNSTLPISRHLSPANSSRSLYIDMDVDSADESSTINTSKGLGLVIPTTTTTVHSTRNRENSITTLLINVNDNICSTNNTTVQSEHSPTETTSAMSSSSTPMFFSNNVRTDSMNTITDTITSGTTTTGLDMEVVVDEKVIATINNTFRLVPLRRGPSTNNPDNSMTNIDSFNTLTNNTHSNLVNHRPSTSSITGNIRLSDIDEDAALTSSWRNININEHPNTITTTNNNNTNNNMNPASNLSTITPLGIGGLNNKTSHGRRSSTTFQQNSSRSSFHRRESLVNTRMHHNQGTNHINNHNHNISSTNTSRNTSALNSPRNEYENTSILIPGVSTITHRNHLNNAGVNILNNTNNTNVSHYTHSNNHVLYNQPKHH